MLEKIQSLIYNMKKEIFLTPFSLVFDILIGIFVFLYIREISNLKTITDEETSKEAFEYTCTINTEFSGGVQYSVYTFGYDQTLSITEVRPYPYISLQSNETSVIYMFDLPMSAKNNPEEYNYTLYQETYTHNLDSLKDFYDSSSGEYNIIFEVLGQDQGKYTTQYYLLDGQKNFIKITKQDAEEIFDTAQKLSLYGSSD